MKRVTRIENYIKRVHLIEEIQAKAACSLYFGGKIWDKKLNLLGTGTVPYILAYKSRNFGQKLNNIFSIRLIRGS